ncbi:MAG: TonB-dependent receptor plug domain-containing protein, partial [Candidatus Omnitrophica bacterium]|nr:TonB-dependent receptor plug domain-containing protein [Candidatus Omnitrophota bacterium]
MKKKILFFFGILVVFIIGNVLADQKKYDLGKIIVTATKTLNYQAEVGSSTTVISEDEINRSGKKTVYEVLKGIAGVSVVQNSAFGGVTSIYLRGAKPAHALILVDGVEVNDPMSTDRSFDFAHLTVDNIERIEIVRGPQSTLYGSDAIAGVINIITKKGEGKPTLSGYFEAGSHNTFKENLVLAGNLDKLDYSVSVSRLDTDGINKVASGSEDDGYKNTVISSKIGYKIFDNSELSLVTRFTDAKTSLDDGSYDGTFEVIKNSGFKYLRNERNMGKGYSLKRGFEYCIKNGYFACITLDADCQHPIELIPEFLKKLQNADIIIGSRKMDLKVMPMDRYLSNKLNSTFISIICSKRILDSQSGYRAIRCEVLKRVKLNSNRFELESELIMKACWSGFKIDFLEIPAIYSLKKTHINRL